MTSELAIPPHNTTSVWSSYLGMQFGGVLSTSHVANNFMGTGREAENMAEEAACIGPVVPEEPISAG